MLQFLLDALIRAADIMLVAVGLSAVYSLAKFPNVAHVQFAMAGAFITLWLFNLGIPLPLACLLSALIVGAAAVATHKLVFERLLKVSPAIAMVGSLALAMIITAVVLGIAGSRPQRYELGMLAPIVLGDARISQAHLASMLVGAAVLISFALVVFKTDLGRRIRAVATNPVLAAATGINPKTVTITVVFISGCFAAIGGTLLALTSDVHVNMGNDLLLPVFAAAILGGLGSPMGAVFGALLIAVAETAVTNINFSWLTGDALSYLPVSYITAASFLFLLLALIFKPHGLFDKEVRRV